jgi:hypothetical protein
MTLGASHAATIKLFVPTTAGKKQITRSSVNTQQAFIEFFWRILKRRSTNTINPFNLSRIQTKLRKRPEKGDLNGR